MVSLVETQQTPANKAFLLCLTFYCTTGWMDGCMVGWILGATYTGELLLLVVMIGNDRASFFLSG
jgi:hypothetical protein